MAAAPNDTGTDRTVAPPANDFICRELNRWTVTSPLNVYRLGWGSDDVRE